MITTARALKIVGPERWTRDVVGIKRPAGAGYLRLVIFHRIPIHFYRLYHKLYVVAITSLASIPYVLIQSNVFGGLFIQIQSRQRTGFLT